MATIYPIIGHIIISPSPNKIIEATDSVLEDDVYENDSLAKENNVTVDNMLVDHVQEHYSPTKEHNVIVDRALEVDV